MVMSRRNFLRGAAVAAVGLPGFIPTLAVSAQSSGPGFPLPDESVESTIKRLFGHRTFQRGDDKMKLELPLIAEDGGNVAVTVESSLPVSGPAAVSSIYIIADKNRRPLLAKFSFTADSGRAFVSTAVRLATSTDVRAVAEMNDGGLFVVSKHVRVTISGCDLPPQS